MARAKFSLISFLAQFKKEAKKFSFFKKRGAIRVKGRLNGNLCACPMDVAFAPLNANWTNVVNRGLLSEPNQEKIIEAADETEPDTKTGQRLRKQLLKIAGLTAMLMLFLVPGAKAWPACSGHWVSVPKGTTGGTLYSTGDLLFQCQPNVPTPPQGPAQSQTQQQTQQQNQNQTATGGSSSSTATGGSSDLKNVGNSQLMNSGNSSNKNTNTAQGGAGGSANSTASSNSSATNNGNNSNDSSYNSQSTYNEVKQNPGAYAPTAAFTTSPCSKGFSGGGSTSSLSATLGIVLTDKGCDSRQTALNFYAIGNPTAAARVLCSTSAAKRANLKLEDCLLLLPPVVIAPPIAAPAPQPIPVSVTIVPVPVSAPEVRTVEVKQTATLIEIGHCKFVTTTAPSGGCSTALHELSPKCIALLDLAISKANGGKVVLTGPTYIARAAAYVKKHLGPNTVIFNVQQQDSIDVQVYSVQ